MPNVNLSVQGEFVLPQEVVSNFKFWFVLVSTTCLAVANIILNFINMAVFIKMGLRESVNFTLFCLSVSDMMGAVLVTSMMSNISGGDVWILGVRVDFISYASVVSMCRVMFVDLSTAITVFITCERCLCVVLPFRFTSAILAKRTEPALLGIVVIVVANYVPEFSVLNMTSIYDQTSNSTLLILLMSDLGLDLQKYNEFAFGIVLSSACQIIIFVCIVFMYRGLKRTGQVRRSTAKLLGGKDETQSLSHKEKRVVQMILVLAALYLLSSVPQIGYCWPKYLIPDLSDLGMRHFNMIVGNVIICMNTAYGAFSFLVYLHFNRTFRLTLSNLFFRNLSGKKQKNVHI